MNYDMDWLYDIFYLEIWHIFSIIISVMMMVYIYLNAKKSPLLSYYLVLQAILLAWLICKVFKTVAPTAETKWIWIVAQYAAVCFLGSVFLLFSFLYAKGKPLSLPATILLNLPPAAFFIIIATNEKHHLFYATYDFWGDTFGPVFYLFSAVNYLYLAIGIYLCATCFRKQFGKRHIQARFFIAGTLIPLIVNALYVAGLTEPRFDITPVSTNLSLLIFAYAIYKYQFLDIVPIGIISSLDTIAEGVLWFHENGRIIYCNPAVDKIFGLPADSGLVHITEITSLINKNSPQNDIKIRDAGGAIPQNHLIHFPGPPETYFFLYLKPLPGQGKLNTRFIMVLSERTAYQTLIADLEERNGQLTAANKKLREYARDLENLAIIQERNRIAGEIHDILGHSLTLILNILESCSIQLDTNPVYSLETVKHVIQEARAGMNEMNRLFHKRSHRQKSTEQLRLAFKQMADKFRFTGMKVEITFKGYHRKIPSECYFALFRIGQEALTNALKHGKADQVHVFLRFYRDAELYVLDNGKGCLELIKGTGISNMEQRVKKLSGTLAYGSPEDGSFMVHAKIPLEIYPPEML